MPKDGTRTRVAGLTVDTAKHFTISIETLFIKRFTVSVERAA